MRPFGNQHPNSCLDLVFVVVVSLSLTSITSQFVAGVVTGCGMLFRFPIWAPQYAVATRVSLIVLYFVTRRRVRGPRREFLEISEKLKISPWRKKATSQYVFAHATESTSTTSQVTTVSHQLRPAVIKSIVAEIVFLIIAGISQLNNTLIVCS